MTVNGLYPATAGIASASAPKDLESACRALEKEFVRLVFQEMRATVSPSTGGAAAGFAREATEGMLDDQWAELASRGEGLGLWRTMVRQLSDEEVKSDRPNADQKTRIGPGPREGDLRAQGGAAHTGLPLDATSRVRGLPLAGRTDAGRGQLPGEDREGT